MTPELQQIVGSLVLAWLSGLATGFTFRGLKHIVERASRP